MANSIDFILPSCYGLPDDIWIKSSEMLNITIKKCWVLLGAFVAIKMLVIAFSDVGEERFALRKHLRILLQGLLIAVFLTYYKSFLMTIDYLIDSLCVFNRITFKATQEFPTKCEWVNFIIRKLLALTDVLALITHVGAVKLMHYIKSITLLVLLQFGPLAALFSLLPGPFRQSFNTWAKSYLYVSCWTLTLAIMDVLANSFSFFKEDVLAYPILYLVLYIAIILTPAWTAKLISGVSTVNILGGIGMVTGEAIIRNKSSKGKNEAS
jgi:hypothetical protein